MKAKTKQDTLKERVADTFDWFEDKLTELIGEFTEQVETDKQFPTEAELEKHRYQVQRLLIAELKRRLS